MDNKVIIKKIDATMMQLERIPVSGHELRKCMVFAQENLIQLMQELDKEEKEKAEVKEHEAAEAE